MRPTWWLLWNEAQRREAIELHGVPAERIRVTGAFAYDHWFDWSAATTRQEFCERVGLDPARPYVLYVGSSQFIAPAEGDWIAEWIRGLRETARLDGVQVLIRPHPDNPLSGSELAIPQLSAMPDVSVHPPEGTNPTNLESRQHYFDSFVHSGAVTGVNTSAFIEAAIVGRPTHALLTPRYADTQAGTLHFRHLLTVGGGLLRTATTFDEHARQLAASLRNPDRAAARQSAFVEAFVRPAGADGPACVRVADEIENLGGAAVAADPSTGPAVRAVGTGLAYGARLAVSIGHRRAQRAKRATDARRAAKAAAVAAAPDPIPPEPGRRRKPRREKEPTAERTRTRPTFEAALDEEDKRARHTVAQLAESDRPVLVGPFLSEVGFELLYWIPFLRWAVATFPALRGRLVVVSRGGVESWLTGIEANYADVFSVMPVSELVARRPSQKQREVTELDRELLDRVERTLGLSGSVNLHPGVLFNQYYRLLKAQQHGYAKAVQRDGSGAVAGATARYEPLPPPPVDAIGAQLPDEYVAARFYFRPSFPDSEANRAFARRTVEALTQTCPVVLLNNRIEIDDHSDFEPDGERIVTIHEHMTPETNLAVQTAALAGARAFVGTYGGLAYLAPHFGVPSIAFSSHPEHAHPWHLELAQRVFAEPPWGSLVSLRTGDLPLLRLLAPGALAVTLAGETGGP